MAPKLLPCPFCGSPDIDPEGWESAARPEIGEPAAKGPTCLECHATAQSVDIWNKRHPEPVKVVATFNRPIVGIVVCNNVPIVATESGVYRMVGDKFEPVEFRDGECLP